MSAAAIPQDQPAPVLLGCMTGASQEVALKITQAALSAKAKDFLVQVLVASFGTAGYQQRARNTEPGLWCPFDLAEWAKRHNWDRHYLWRIRKQVVDLGILAYEVSAEDPSRGWLRWSLDFDAWRALSPDYRRSRYTRQGAGRKPQSNVSRSPADEQSNVIQSSAYPESNVIQPVIKCDTPARYDAGTGAARLRVVRMGEEDPEKNIQTDANASGAALRAPTPAPTAHDHAADADDTLEPSAGDAVAVAGGATGNPPGSDVAAQQRLPIAQDSPPTPSLLDSEEAPPSPDSAPPPPPASPAPKPEKRTRKPRELSVKDQYRVDLIAAIEEALGGVKAPKHGQEWSGAGRLYEAHHTIERVVAFYRVERERPKWDATYLSLTSIAGCIESYLRDPARWREGIARARKAANGEYDSPTPKRGNWDARGGSNHGPSGSATGQTGQTGPARSRVAGNRPAGAPPVVTSPDDEWERDASGAIIWPPRPRGSGASAY